MDDEKRTLFNKRQLKYYYDNKEIYKNYYEKNKQRIRMYNTNYKKTKQKNMDPNKPSFRKKKLSIPIIVQKGIFIVDFD